MDVTILLLVLGGLTFVTFFCLLAASLVRSSRVRERVVGEQTKSRAADGTTAKSWFSFLEPLGRALPSSEEEGSRQQKRLIMAGYRGKNTLAVFYGARVVVGVTVVVVLAFLGVPQDNILLFIVLPFFLGAAIPDLWLKQAIKNRQLQIQLGLPDMTDLAVICVESGMGLDQAFSRISKVLSQSHPALSDELKLYVLQLNAGQTRAQALRNLGERTGVDDMKALTVTLIQADRFGTEVGKTLSVYSETLRTKRRQRAEEHAAQMGVKLLFPLMLFIFPGIFIVVAGPAVIAIMRDLLPTLAGE